MSVVIFGDLFTFPDGQAATNRIYTYAKGLKENGINVYVVCFSSNYMEQPDGTSQGIPYFHPFRQKVRNKNFFIRRLQNLAKNFNAYQVLRRINKEDRITAINGWSSLLSTHLIGWFFAKLLRAKFISEISEHPLRDYQTGFINRKRGLLRFYIESRFCDGIFCISRFLVDFHIKHGVNKRKLFLIPSTVDPSRFALNGKKPEMDSYIGYFGSLTFKRDSVDMLIKAFSVFHTRYPEVYLVLGGFCSMEMKEQINRLIDDLGLTQKVIILNYLTRDEIIKYIVHAKALVMVRSKDLESQASYPSKLSEFLSTGKPVVTVNVGEISDYIKDGENGYLVEPGDVEAMAEKLSMIFGDYDRAAAVGIKGKELTDTVFHYNYQAKRMIQFINAL